MPTQLGAGPACSVSGLGHAWQPRQGDERVSNGGHVQQPRVSNGLEFATGSKPRICQLWGSSSSRRSPLRLWPGSWRGPYDVDMSLAPRSTARPTTPSTRRHWPHSICATASHRRAVSYTHLRAHETRHDLVCRLLLEKKKTI